MRATFIVLAAVAALCLLALSFLRQLTKRPTQPELVQVELGEDQVRQKLKGTRDFRIRVDLDGAVTAHCKSCDVAMRTAERDGIIWFRCPKCNRVSLYPVGNLARDKQFAIKDGKAFEYELYFVKDLPPELKPPI